MLTMQLFHRQLFQLPELHDPLMQGLAQLTRATPADLVALASNVEWTPWGAETD